MSRRSILLAALLVAALAGLAYLFLADGPVSEWTAEPPLKGEFARFIVHEEPQPALLEAFLTQEGGKRRIADFEGRYILVNIWASWCAGSRSEVPTLDILQETLGGDQFSVVLIASDPGGWEPVNRMLDDLNIGIADRYLDDGLATMRESRLPPQMGSILYNESGRELGRLEGHANWDTPEAFELIRYFINSGDR